MTVSAYKEEWHKKYNWKKEISSLISTINSQSKNLLNIFVFLSHSQTFHFYSFLLWWFFFCSAVLLLEKLCKKYKTKRKREKLIIAFEQTKNISFSTLLLLFFFGKVKKVRRNENRWKNESATQIPIIIRYLFYVF